MSISFLNFWFMLLQHYDTNKLWKPADSDGWRSSSAPRSYWPPPPNESNGYLRVRCNGGLNQQRSAVRKLFCVQQNRPISICNAVVAARIMNATLVLPELDTNSFWHDESCDVSSMLSSCLQVGLVLQAMGFNNSARIYLAAGELFGGERFITPFRAMFPHLENHSTVGPSEKLEGNARGLVGSAVDYMVSLLSDIFIPTYDGPSNFANNLMGHRLYYGFRTTIQPNRKALAPIFMDREKGRADGFEERIRQVMFNSKFGGPHKRVYPESFYTNSWPECFCLLAPASPVDKCPPDNILEILHGQLQSQQGNDSEPDMMSYRRDGSASQEEVQYGS
ncbi:hypothetical protein BHE74_00002897 [Ensete ventricosum]|nr:hypothetical protein BHE74_00002897 [Ensete ventricosum]